MTQSTRGTRRIVLALTVALILTTSCAGLARQRGAIPEYGGKLLSDQQVGELVCLPEPTQDIVLDLDEHAAKTEAARRHRSRWWTW